MHDESPRFRYVVLRHEGFGEPHFDLMVEVGPTEPLWTFRCTRWPVTVEDVLVQLPDHRREYLDYEGPISGGRGWVRRIEAGHAQLAVFTTSPPQRALSLDAPRRLALRQVLDGQRRTDRWQVVEAGA